MKLHKRLNQSKFTVGIKGNYEQHAHITMWKVGSNTYKIIVEEFNAPNEVEYEKFICDKRKSQIIWSNLLLKYKELEEVYRANPY